MTVPHGDLREARHSSAAGPYELAPGNAVEPPQPSDVSGVSPTSGRGGQPSLVLPYRRVAPSAAPPIDFYFPSKFRDLIAPAGLLAAGMGLGFLELLNVEGNVADAGKTATAYVILQAFLLLIAIPVMTRMVGVALGTLPSAVLKLCAIAILPAALGIGTGIAAGCVGIVLAVPVTFVACWAMFAGLFGLDLTESRLCAAIYCVLGAMIPALGTFGLMWFFRFLFRL